MLSSESEVRDLRFLFVAPLYLYPTPNHRIPTVSHSFGHIPIIASNGVRVLCPNPNPPLLFCSLLLTDFWLNAWCGGLWWRWAESKLIRWCVSLKCYWLGLPHHFPLRVFRADILGVGWEPHGQKCKEFADLSLIQLAFSPCMMYTYTPQIHPNFITSWYH
jgi:hypothetical protein